MASRLRGMAAAGVVQVALVALGGCADEAHLAARARQYCELSRHPSVGAISLPVFPGTPMPSPPAVRVVITASSLLVDGGEAIAVEPGGEPDATGLKAELTAAMARQAAVAKGAGKEPGDVLQLAAAHGAEVATVAAVFRAAHAAGYRQVHLIGRPTNHADLLPPVDPVFAEELRREPPDRRLAAAMAAIDGAVTFCGTPVLHSAAEPSATDPCVRLENDVREMFGGVCIADESVVLTALYVALVPSQMTTFAARELDPEAKPVSFVNRQLWGNTVAELIRKDVKKVWLLGAAPAK